MKKIIGILLSMTLVVGSVLTVSAAPVTGGEVGSPSSGTVAISVSVPEEWSFTIPAEVELQVNPESVMGEDGTRLYQADFDVNVKGEIAASHCVGLTLGELVLKTSESDPGVSATITNGKTTWSCQDCFANSNAGTTATYTVKANLLPGSYNGVLNYTFELRNVE